MFLNKRLFAVMGLVVLTAPAASQEFVIPWSSIDGGGGHVGAGAFELFGAIGQPDAGSLQGGGFEILGGFVPGIAATPGCSVADVAEPYGVINFFDIVTYIQRFNAMDPAADLAAPFGSLNFFDVVAYIGVFNQGCP